MHWPVKSSKNSLRFRHPSLSSWDFCTNRRLKPLFNVHIGERPKESAFFAAFIYVQMQLCQ